MASHDSRAEDEEWSADSSRSSLSVDTESVLPMVLVVDDEHQILKAVSRLLAPVDCEVLTVENGQNAIALLDDRDIAVLVSDQRMPGITGTALLEYAADHHPETVRIMVTGNGNWQTAMEAVNQGQVFRFVAKPWDHDQFVQVVTDAIDHHDLICSRARYESYISRQNAELRKLNDQLEERVRKRTRDVVDHSREVTRLNQALEASFNSSIKAMLAIMEIGDIEIVGHCRKTAEHVRQLADFVDLDPDWARHVERAGLLHWIGLINAPADMFKKPVSQYNAEEMATWEFHPTLGQQAVAQVPALDAAGKIIVNYLRGYDDPTFAAGDGADSYSSELVEACYILNICSSYERTRRVELRVDDLGRQAADELGLARLQAGRGDAFSPRLVDQFCTMVAEQTESRDLERRVPLDGLQEGMVLSRPVETAVGVPVAPRDMVVTAELIARLTRFQDSKGLGAIFVHRE